MAGWEVTATFLFVFGLLKEFKPSEPFFFEYAVENKNLPSDYMLHRVLPYTTYGGLPALFIFLFTTDFLRYKPVIIFGAFSSVLSWIILIWAYDHFTLHAVRQVVDSISTSSEIAYYTYMYSNVDHSHFKFVTSLNHAAVHTGRFLGSLTGQLLMSQASLHLPYLNYVTLGGVSLALSLSFFLPPVKRAVYFRSRKSIVALGRIEFGLWARLRKGGIDFCTEIWKTYSNRYILKWSFWWSIATAIYLQVALYIEPLWRTIEEETNQTIYNGAVDATQALLSAILGMCVPSLKIPWIKFGEIYLTLISFTLGAALILMSQTANLYWSYGGYILFQVLFQVMIIAVTAEVAEGVSESNEAFIFGLNMTFALVIQTIITFTITSWFGFELDIRREFLVYGLCSCALGLCFFLISLQSRRKFFNLGGTRGSIDIAENEEKNKEKVTARKSSTVSM